MGRTIGLVFLMRRKKKTAQTYYIDATSGNDANAGTQAAPWKTISKVNAANLAAGSSVLFKRGETFAGKILPTKVGTATATITYGAYGTGANPVIDGSDETSALYINNYSIAYLRFENLDLTGGSTYSVCYLYGPHDLYFTGCTFRDSPSQKGVSVSSLSGHAPHDITFVNCEFKNNHMTGAISADLTAYNILFQGGSAHDNGSALGDHGYYIGGGTTCDGVDAYSNYDGGIKLNDNEVESFVYPIAKNSKSHANANGIILTHKNATVSNNLIYGNGNNIVVIGNTWGGYTVVFNTFVNGTDASQRNIAFSAGVSPNSIFKNNIFVQDLAVVSKGIFYFATGLGMSDYASMIDYNTYYMNGSLTDTKFCYSTTDTGAETKSWNNFRTAGAEAHGTYLTALPEFVTRYSDFAALESGNLKGLGVALEGYSTDYNGVNRTNPPTPGALDYSTPIPIAFSAAEIGVVNKSTVAVTFSTKCAASNYSTGVTIKVGGATATISSATRQTDTTKVYYVLSAPVAEGDTVTWEYTGGNYTNLAGTETLATVTAQSVTNTVSSTICAINLNAGNLNEFSSVVDTNSKLSAAAGAALNSTAAGLNCVIDSTTAFYGEKTFTASTTGVFRCRIFIDPNTMTMGTNNQFYVLSFYNGTSALCDLMLRYNGGFILRCDIVDDAAAVTESGNKTIADAPRRVELMLTRASSNVASDGKVEIFVDGGAATAVTGKDNYDRFPQVTKIQWGAVGGVDSGTSGTFFMDELIMKDVGTEIGA